MTQYTAGGISIVIDDSHEQKKLLIGYGHREGDKTISPCCVCNEIIEHDNGQFSTMPCVRNVVFIIRFCSQSCMDRYIEKKDDDPFFESNMMLLAMSYSLEVMYSGKVQNAT